MKYTIADLEVEENLLPVASRVDSAVSSGTKTGIG